MLDLKVLRITDVEVVKRPMTELEIWGAIVYINHLVNDWCDEFNCTIQDIDIETYYCNRTLECSNTLGGFMCTDTKNKDIVLESVFVLEDNYSDLFGYAFEQSNEDDLFLVRISQA